MAENVMLNVSPTFDLTVFSNRLAGMLQSKGYSVGVFYMANSSILTISKGTGGINTILGLGISVKANCILSGGVLSINFSDEEWTSKIIGAVIGCFLCLIPLITAIVGVTKQLDLPKEIRNDATMIVSSMQ